jgi:hypothetical protein
VLGVDLACPTTLHLGEVAVMIRCHLRGNNVENTRVSQPASQPASQPPCTRAIIA